MSNQKEVICEYCGEKFSSRGIYNHKKHCEKNPENRKLNFKFIIPKKSVSLKVNGKYYKLEKGARIEVNNEVANILNKAKICEVVGE